MLCPAFRESGHRLGRFLYYMSWEHAPRFTLRRNSLDAMELKTNLRAHILLDATIEWTGPPKFFGKRFGYASAGCGSLYCVERRFSLHLGSVPSNCMSIPVIKCERKTAKATLLFSSIKSRKDHLLPELKIFAGIDHLRRAGEWISR